MGASYETIPQLCGRKQKKFSKKQTHTKTETEPVPEKVEVEEIIDCVICLDLDQDVSELVKLECGHEFHAQCLADWTRRSKTCPMCRKPAHYKIEVEVDFGSLFGDDY